MDSNTPMNNVPIELWIDILSMVPRSNLAQVIQVGHWILADVGRFLLYSSVHLRSDDPSVDMTLDLLSRRDDLAKRLKSVTLTTNAQPEKPVSPALLSACERINLSGLAGRVAGDTADIDVFTLASHSLPALELSSFVPRAWHRNFLVLAAVTSERQVDYKTDLGRLEYPILKILGACHNNLTHIVFGGTLDLRDRTYYLFLSMGFPQLVSIEMGSLYRSNRADPINEAITEFLVAHPLIQHLSLGRRRPPGGTFFQLHGPLINAGFLPNLKSFEGFPSNVQLLAERRVASLEALTHLSLFILPGEKDNMRRMREAVWAALPSTRDLPSVVYLRAEFEVELSHLMASNTTSLDFHRCCDFLAELCPNVTYFYGTLPIMSSGHLETLFRDYQNLEVINLPRLSLFMGMREREKEYFGRISQRCLNLRQIVARKPDHTQVDDLVYNIERNGDMDLAKVTVDSVPRFEVPHV